MRRPSPICNCRLKARVMRALGHPLRLAIAEYLGGGERCVCEIAEWIGAGRPNVSRHLALMRSAGVVEFRSEGPKALYRLKTPCVVEVLSCVEKVLRQQNKRRSASAAKRATRDEA